MCGIVGYLGSRDIESVILVGLERLEYRGYDSCGIAVADEGKIKITKVTGRLQNLKDALEKHPLSGDVGIGHTRWATHGPPTQRNAHPFTDPEGLFAVVHNGIIENHAELRRELEAKGHKFVSQTDSEIIPHLLASYYKGNLLKAVLRTLKRLKGSFALVAVMRDRPDCLLGVRMGSPLVVGIGKGEFALASDPLALVGITQRMIALDDGEVVLIHRGHLPEVYSFDGKRIKAKVVPIEFSPKAVSKGRYRHFMRKEIFEQPKVIANSLERRIRNGRIVLGSAYRFYPEELADFEHILIQACGTSYHAGLVARYFIERFTGVHTEVEIASELIDRTSIFGKHELMIAISQSGETADTLAALRAARRNSNLKVLSIVNVKRTSVDRESDSSIYIHAGPEIGVASTKAYTAELFALLIFTLELARRKATMKPSQLRKIKSAFSALPDQMAQVLKQDRRIREIARQFQKRKSYLFLGRGVNFPTALEGALKLKEISYIHATGYPAGEMKHGPISLIDSKTPVVVVAPRDATYEKMNANIEEVAARGGQVIAVGTAGDHELAKRSAAFIPIPEAPDYILPFLTVIPLQLLAYHTACFRGCDVDKPRNLAKSVTVE
ncbi:MAG: glutamine--fructose-6-phosphate transaminase (isomerizing) [Candidatus Stahlbacteria bacterium]|nr:MAG: glutamine--fructose-6-phosphate transaminase (isomerizing) [Candidatus Stahlbacteria bacterium]